jgi:hypothetical protein
MKLIGLSYIEHEFINCKMCCVNTHNILGILTYPNVALQYKTKTMLCSEYYYFCMTSIFGNIMTSACVAAYGKSISNA